MTFDPSRATLKQPDIFPRFRVPDGAGSPLRELGLRANELLAVVERGGARLGFRIEQLAHHHLAQGRLAGEPYAVSF